MSMWQRRLATLTAFLVLMCTAINAAATSEEDVATTIHSLDSQFWNAYNACDTEAQRLFFTDDVEFYHDKGGPTFGADALIETIRNNLCSGSTRVRREAIESTVHVFPLRREGVVYGAIMSGDHRFYGRAPDRPEAVDGVARFTHLWLLKDGRWRIARVLSYDHGPAPYVNTRKAVTVPDAVLDSFVGTYRTGQGPGTVRRQGGTLVLSFEEGDSFVLYPEADTSFFTKERDLTFEFARRATDGVVIMRVRENGAVVDEGVAERWKK